MKKTLQTLIIGILVLACGTISKLKNGNSFEVQRIGIMDTITVNVIGEITDLYDKSGLKEAEIELSNNENLYEQTCRQNGEFKFDHISSGKYRIMTKYVGYYIFRDSIELKSGEIVELKIGLGFDE